MNIWVYFTISFIIIYKYSHNVHMLRAYLLCTSKHRRCDTTALVRNIPETFLRDWDYPNYLPFVPKRRCLLG